MKRLSVFYLLGRVSSAALCAAALAAGGCQPVVLEGRVLDRQGEGLPGVAVTIEGTRRQCLTDVLGVYSVGTTVREAALLFTKTGYAPGRVEVEAEGRFEVETVRLWRLPPSQGVYLLEDHRYLRADPMEPERYDCQGKRPVYGVKRPPRLDATDTCPTIVSHKMPRHDVRMSRLEGRECERMTSLSAGVRTSAWIPMAGLAVRLLPLDEPEGLLQQILYEGELEPGVYAVHWGGLDGYTTTETRVFCFRVTPGEKAAPATDDMQEKRR